MPRLFFPIPRLHPTAGALMLMALVLLPILPAGVPAPLRPAPPSAPGVVLVVAHAPVLM
ncbi:hypothetical protein [Novosphingobium soli]|uniref:Uncharacterized protein n=1 Tax=Novosphingobium soli TaxID=574956 RepID=A0ABV6CXT0_9SPHN